MSVTCTAVHGNAGSLTHWARPGIKLASSWILVGFITAEPHWELPGIIFYIYKFNGLKNSIALSFQFTDLISLQAKC